MGALSDVQANVIRECIRIREAHGATQTEVLRIADKEYRTSVSRWERGKWGEEADTIIAAYALLEGVSPHVIWERALRITFREELRAEERRLRRLASQKGP